MKYQLIFIFLIFLFSCGEAPSSWEGALVSEDGNISDSGGTGDSGGDENNDPPPPEEKKLFLLDQNELNQNYQNIYSGVSNYNWTINSQTGWCYNPNNGSISETELEFNLSGPNFSYTYNYTFPSGTVQSDGLFFGNFNYDGPGSSSAETQFEIRFNSEFTSMSFYFGDGNGGISENASWWGEVFSDSSCD